MVSLMNKVDQTIFHDDPLLPGNCAAACVATFLGMPMNRVPHFVALGRFFSDNKDDRCVWWGTMVGFMSALGYWPFELGSLDEADEDEIVFVSGQSPRGDFKHQVLYKNGELWHDPHPSRAGIKSIDGILAWRLTDGPLFRHDPTPKD